MRTLILALFTLALGGAEQPKTNQGGKEERKLWAAITVNQVLFEPEELGKLQLYIGIINEGAKPVDPKLEESELFVNGQELKDWQYIMSNGIRDGRFNRLPPGDYLRLAPGIGRHFKSPGIYRIKLKGNGYVSNETVFRVLPKSNR